MNSFQVAEHPSGSLKSGSICYYRLRDEMEEGGWVLEAYREQKNTCPGRLGRANYARQWKGEPRTGNVHQLLNMLQ